MMLYIYLNAADDIFCDIFLEFWVDISCACRQAVQNIKPHFEGGTWVKTANRKD